MVALENIAGRVELDRHHDAAARDVVAERAVLRLVERQQQLVVGHGVGPTLGSGAMASSAAQNLAAVRRGTRAVASISVMRCRDKSIARPSAACVTPRRQRLSARTEPGTLSKLSTLIWSRVEGISQARSR